MDNINRALKVFVFSIPCNKYQCAECQIIKSRSMFSSSLVRP